MTVDVCVSVAEVQLSGFARFSVRMLPTLSLFPWMKLAAYGVS